MIGQARLLAKINNPTWTMPRFMILSGPRGSGKRLVARKLADQDQAQLISCGSAVADVRSVITLATKLSGNIVFFFPDADNMRPAAKNALLKITEEAPREAKFLLATQDSSLLLETLRSRAYLQNMDPYSWEELKEFTEKIAAPTEGELQVVKDVCETPGDVEILVKSSAEEFENYVIKVIDNLATVSPANCLKITSSIATKPESPGWDPILFMRAFMIICNIKREEGLLDGITAYQAIRNTMNYLDKFRINGINKVAVIDSWLLDMLEVFGNDPTQ